MEVKQEKTTLKQRFIQSTFNVKAPMSAWGSSLRQY